MASRSLADALDCLQLDLAILANTAADLMAGKVVTDDRLLVMAARRLKTSRWHPRMADLVPRAQRAAAEVDSLLLVSRLVVPGEIPPLHIQEELDRSFGVIEGLRREVAHRKFRVGASKVLMSAFPCIARTRRDS